MTSRLAHDLKSPLTTMQLKVQALLRAAQACPRTCPPDTTDKLTGVQTQIERMVDLINERLGVEPATVTARAKRPKTSSLRLPDEVSRGRVLAVDDDPTYLAELVGLLREEGDTVETAGSGEEALVKLSGGVFDVILLDSMMPGMGGEEACVRIKSTPSWRDVPLVILTSDDSRDAMIAGINAGADDFIAKTSDLEVLKVRLRAQLRRKYFEDQARLMRDKLVRQEAETAKSELARAHAEASAALLADLEQKNVELERARVQAEGESHFKSKFLASMSHELRTPLNAIIGFSELLEQQLFGPLNPRQRDYIGNVLASGRHLLGLVNEVLDLSKIAAGRVPLALEKVAVNDLLTDVEAALWSLAEKKGLSLLRHPEHGLPVVFADPLRLRQVFYNLLSNAIKFTPSGGTVEVSTRSGEAEISVSVRDTGVGIRREDLPRLFREFERLGDALEQQEGTGLGLALSKRLIELHGGDIEVESTPGMGSTFTVRLPRPGRRAHPAASVTTPPPPV